MTLTLPSNLVEALPHLSGGAIKTYLSLTLLQATGKTYPTQEDIASTMHASSRSVLTYLKELEAEGYLTKEPVGAGRKMDYVLVTESVYDAR